jgi:hypothetical protein
MGRLIDQFVGALEEWARRTGTPGDAWAGTVLLWTGGSVRHKRVGAVDLTTIPKEQRASLTLGQVHGHLTVDQMHQDLRDLVGRVHMDEEFLVVSLIQAIERKMENLSEEYAKGLRKRREEAGRIEAILNDPAQLKAYLQQSTEDLNEGDEAASEATLIRAAEHFRRWSVSSLQEQRDRRVELDTWRAVSAPIVDPRNLRQFRKEEAERMGFPSIPEDD